MATITLRPSGDGTTTGWSHNGGGTFAADIVDDPDSNDGDTSYVASPDVATGTMWVSVRNNGNSDVPADFDPDAINSITIKIATRRLNTPAMAVDSGDIQGILQRSDESTAISTTPTAQSSPISGSYSTLTFTPSATGTHTVADWNAARCALVFTHTSNQTPDTVNQARITGVEIIVDYTPLSGTVYENTASASGIATTAVALAVIAGLGGVSAAGASTTATDMATVREVAAQVDAVSSATVSLGVKRGLAAASDGAGATSLGTLYRRVEVASSGTLGGTATTAVDLAAIRALQPTADGVGATTADIFRAAHRDTQADGLSTTAVSVNVITPSGTQYELIAAPDGTSTAVSTVFRFAYRDAQADGVGAVTLSLDAIRSLAPSAAGTSTTAVSLGVKRGVSAQADGAAASTISDDLLYRRVVIASDGSPAGVGTATITAIVVNAADGIELTAQADGVGTATTTMYTIVPVTMGDVAGVSTATVSMDVVSGLSTQADGISTTAVDLAVVRALGNTQSDGVSTTTASLVGTSVVELIAQADGTSSTTSSVLRQAHRDTQADGTSSATVSVTPLRGLTTQADGASTTAVDVATIRSLAATAAGAATTTVAVTTVLGTTPVVGKYAAEHARAYAMVKAIEEGDFTRQHARAFTLIDRAGG